MAFNLATRIIRFTGISVLRSFDFLVQTFATNKALWAENSFPFRDELGEGKATFLREYEDLLRKKEIYNVKDFYKVETDLKYDENWKAAPLILFSYLFSENAQLCPETFKIISRLPGCCGAMFSVLGPGKHIPPHKGIYKGIYRCLLTLKVQPDSECWIKVNQEKLYFKEGECIVFDETFEHEVLNASTQPRVVLYLDFYRKLPFPLSVFNDMVFQLLRRSAFATTILGEYGKLEKTTIKDFVPVPAILP